VLVLFSGELSVANISALSSPEFYIPNLEPAQEYDASIYSFNSKGLYEFVFFAMLLFCARFSIVTVLFAGTCIVKIDVRQEKSAIQFPLLC